MLPITLYYRQISKLHYRQIGTCVYCVLLHVYVINTLIRVLLACDPYSGLYEALLGD